MKSMNRTRLSLFGVLVLLSACADRTASAKLGPFHGLKLNIEVHPSAGFVTDVTTALSLECRTTEELSLKRLAGLNVHSELAKVEARPTTRQISARRFEVELSLDRGVLVVAPDRVGFFDTQECFTFATLLVAYPGASSTIVTGVEGLNVMNSYFTRDLGRAASSLSNADLTGALVKGLEGDYVIKCVPYGTSAGRPVNTLELLNASSGESLGRLSTYLERPCEDGF